MKRIPVQSCLYIRESNSQFLPAILHREIMVWTEASAIKPEPFGKLLNKVVLSKRCTTEYAIGLQDSSYFLYSLVKIRNMIKHGIGNHHIKGGILKRQILNIRHLIRCVIPVSDVLPGCFQHSRGEIRKDEFTQFIYNVIMSHPQASGTAAKFQYLHSLNNLII